MDYHIWSNPYLMFAAGDVASGITSYYQGLVPSVQGLVYALIILIIGVFFAIELSRAVTVAAKKAGFDELFEKAGVKAFLGRAESKFLISGFLGWITKWFVILIFLTAAVNALGLAQVSSFFTQILGYMPNIVAAIAILTLGLLISQLVYEAIQGISETAESEAYHIAALALRALIIIITVLVILQQRGVHTDIINIFAAGIALMIGLGGGIAFGLGGQGIAKELLEEIREQMKRKR